jgi:hypothetical protein
LPTKLLVDNVVVHDALHSTAAQVLSISSTPSRRRPKIGMMTLPFAGIPRPCSHLPNLVIPASYPGRAHISTSRCLSTTFRLLPTTITFATNDDRATLHPVVHYLFASAADGSYLPPFLVPAEKLCMIMRQR